MTKIIQFMKVLSIVIYWIDKENYHLVQNYKIMLLNHRLNEEFKKYFPMIEQIVIIRDTQTNKYWFNENLLVYEVGKTRLNISKSHYKNN